MDRTVDTEADGPCLRRPSGDGPDGPGEAGSVAVAVAVAGAGAGAGAEADVDESGYQPLWVRLACILLDFLTQTYDQIRIVPEIVLFERWVCSSHLPEHAGQSHELCRTPDIQYELARLRSWKAFFDGLASMY